MAFTKINAAGIGTTETVTVDGLTVINDGSFGGNLTVSGVLTYEDVTNVDSVGLITARNGVVVGSGITLSKDGDVFFTGIATGNGSGLTALNASNLASGTVPTARLGSGTASSSTFLRGDSTFQTVNTDLVSDTSPQLGGNLDVNTKNITFGDSGSASDDRLTFGASTDLSIYHDGSHSYISEQGTGNLRILTSSVFTVNNAANSENMILATDGGSVDLYYNGVKKLETKEQGVIISNQGNNRVLDVKHTNGDYAYLAFQDQNTGDNATVRLGAYNQDMLFFAGGSQRLRIASNGDFGFNDTSPTAHGSGNNTVLSIKGRGSSYSGKIDFKDSSGNIDNEISSDNSILFIKCDPNSQNGNTYLRFDVHGSERFRFGRHGQLGIGGATYGTSGQVLKSGGSSAAPTWGAAGKVLQVVHAEKPDHYFSTDTSFNDVASLSVTITPTSSSTKMLITVNVFANCEDAAILRLVRYRADLGTAAIGNGQAGNDANTRGFAMVRQDDGNLGSGYGMQTLHTPGSTVEHTYKVQARCTSSSAALAINRRADDGAYGLVSSISVMEIG